MRLPEALLQHEDRDLPAGLLLVVRVVRVRGDSTFPPLRLLVAEHLAGGHVLANLTVPDLDRGVGDEVVVPQRVFDGTALRRNHGVYPVMLDPHHGYLSQLAA